MQKKLRRSVRENGRNGEESETITYGTELTVYDKHNRCQLAEGNYEVTLQEITVSKVNQKKTASWESVAEGKVRKAF